MKTKILITSIALLALSSSLSTAAPLGTAFTYQGKLTDGGQSANGSYDLKFTLYDAATNGSHVAGPLTVSPVGVTNGLFTAELDFGAGVFTGDARWLEIAVRTNGSPGDFTLLSPRQPLTPAPYALFSPQAGAVSPAGVSASALNTPSPPAPGQVLAYSGSTLTWTNAGSVGGAWLLAGNSGAQPGLNFLGTTDNQPLELKVNSLRALRLEDNGDSSDTDALPDGAPNVIGGSPVNFVAAGVVGATIGGGGATNYGTGAYTNSVRADFGVVGGGLGNKISADSLAATIAGGHWNAVGTNSLYSAIGGGVVNVIAADASSATIAGGAGNDIGDDSTASAIGGGGNNTIAGVSRSATIGGGWCNGVGTNCQASTIGGGEFNNIAANSAYATIAGGYFNDIGTNADHSAIGGGTNNNIAADSPAATIAGGVLNDIGAYAYYSAIGGGSGNNIAAYSQDATIAGGYYNDIGADADFGAIGGGGGNSIAANSGSATIAGGGENDIGSDAHYSAIGGGADNNILAHSMYATIAGGAWNDIGDSSDKSTIGGGNNNNIGNVSSSATIGGGEVNDIGEDSDKSTIGGGYDNNIGNVCWSATIGGGEGNDIGRNSDYSTIGGGYANRVRDNSFHSTIAGGYQNYMSENSDYSTIGGGEYNLIATNGQYATIPGGYHNFAANSAFAAGSHAQAVHLGAFVWGDATDAAIVSKGVNTVTLRATGGYWFFSSADTAVPAPGVYLAPGASSWTTISDRNAKKDIRPVDCQLILDKLTRVPVTQWHYAWEGASDPVNLGPMAQDFKAAFYPGRDDKSISTLEFDGVALAAIQGLNQKLETAVKEKDARIAALEQRNQSLESRLAALEKAIESMQKNPAPNVP